MENQNKVLLITTKGCAGCTILRKLINEAISMYRGTITFEEKDLSECDKKFIKQNKITDFPTTFLIKSDIIRFKFIGTKPSIVIHRWFEVHF